MRNTCLLLAGFATAASALVTGYHVEPRTAAMSTKASGDPQSGGVSQTVTCNFDSLSYVELFAGAKGNGGTYYVAVYGGSQIPDMWGTGTQDMNESWVKFDNWNTHVAFTRGKQYRFRFTRTWQDSIQFYYDGDPYKYGQLIVGQDTYPNRDLAMRAYGRMKAVDSTWWAIVPACPWNGTQQQFNTWRLRMETLGVKRADFTLRWDSIELAPGVFRFDTFGYDTTARELHSLGCVLDARPQRCPPWASSRKEPADTMSHYCAPRNLWAQGESTNYWARFIDREFRGHNT